MDGIDHPIIRLRLVIRKKGSTSLSDRCLEAEKEIWARIGGGELGLNWIVRRRSSKIIAVQKNLDLTLAAADGLVYVRYRRPGPTAWVGGVGCWASIAVAHVRYGVLRLRGGGERQAYRAVRDR